MGESTFLLMTLWLVAALVFLAGASIIRLITKDAVLENARDKWAGHFVFRADEILEDAAALLPARTEYSDPRLSRAERRVGLMEEVGRRSEEEAPVPWWVLGRRRVERQPWTVRSAKLVRLRGYIDFISCPWCVGPWVFGALWLAAWALLGWPYALAGLPFWIFIPGAALAYRWVYALIAMRFDAR